MKSYQIHLIRHGLTEANIKGMYIGATDVDLSDEGEKRLNKLKENFSYPKANRVVSSPLKRCLQTSKILYPETEILIEKDFSECNFGDWEGKSIETLKSDQNFIKWINNSQEVEPKGGESLKIFAKRVLGAFEREVEKAVKSDCKDTVIIAHGGVIMTILAMFGVPKANFYDWIVNNGCGYSVRVMPSLWMRQKVVEVYSKIPSNLTCENKDELGYILDLVKTSSEKGFIDK